MDFSHLGHPASYLSRMAFFASLPASAELIQIYLVRHAKVDYPPMNPNVIHLRDAGPDRAVLLVPTLEGVNIPHFLQTIPKSLPSDLPVQD